MTNYQVTIGFKAVIQIDLNAENEKEAKEKALEMMKKGIERMEKAKGFYIADNNYKADGVVDNDASWNMINL